MEGYVKNKSPMWRHAMKRSIGPDGKVLLDELFEQYGIKHDIKEGKPFVEWLKNVKLRDSNIWEIVYEDEVKKEDKVEKNPKQEQSENLTAPIVKKDKEIIDIINMSVRQARTDLKKITDIKLLKYALGEANKLANKDTLVMMLRKRIRDLEMTRR